MPPLLKTRKRIPQEDVLVGFKKFASDKIGRILEENELTQTEAAYIMRDAPSQISLVVTGKLRGFSPTRLMRMLLRLGWDIDVIIRPAKGKTGKVTYREGR